MIEKIKPTFKYPQMIRIEINEPKVTKKKVNLKISTVIVAE